MRASSLEKHRGWVAVGSLGAGLATIWILYRSLSEPWAHILLDRGHTFPFSVQNGMWIAFAVGLGEVMVRTVTTVIEAKQLRKKYLPEDNFTILQVGDLPDIYRKLRSSPEFGRCFLPRLVERCVLQFQASQSADNSASLLNTSMEMFLHEVDLRYNMIRYLCWLIPSLGFIGTVVGIGKALEYAGGQQSSDPGLLTAVTGMLAVSFNGTFLALVMASILVFLQNIVQAKEEHTLNRAGQYCLDNLINRLYVDKEDDGK